MTKTLKVALAFGIGAIAGVLIGFHLSSDQPSYGYSTAGGPHEVHVLGTIESSDSLAIEIRSCDYLDKGELFSFSLNSKTEVAAELTPGKYVYVTFISDTGKGDPKPGTHYTAYRIEDAQIP